MKGKGNNLSKMMKIWRKIIKILKRWNFFLSSYLYDTTWGKRKDKILFLWKKRGHMAPFSLLFLVYCPKEVILMPIGSFFLGYLIGINLLALLVSGWDKLSAIQGRRRVPENTLMLLAVLLGGMGLYLSFFLFHHKIRKKKFMDGHLLHPEGKRV